MHCLDIFLREATSFTISGYTIFGVSQKCVFVRVAASTPGDDPPDELQASI